MRRPSTLCVPPGFRFTWYSVMGLPLSFGADHVATMVPRLGALTSRPPTWAGGPGVRALTVLPPGPVPTSLIARTWNEYVVPSASPVRANDVPAPTFCHWPFVASWYVVMALPFGHAAAHETATRPVSGVALVMFG